MRSLLIFLTLIVSLAVGGAAWSRPDPGAQAAHPQDQRDLALTIYNGNLGLVKDVREVRLGSGSRQVQFMDVAALIDPTSVTLTSLTDPKGLTIMEQNYAEDLL